MSRTIRRRATPKSYLDYDDDGAWEKYRKHRTHTGNKGSPKLMADVADGVVEYTLMNVEDDYCELSLIDWEDEDEY